jgi:hypothetical protein
MPNLYMGRGGLDGLFGGAKPIGPGNPDPGGSVRPITSPASNGGPTGGPGSVRPITQPIDTGSAPAPASGPPNVAGPGAIRPTGPSGGYDPAYLQNLATSIGSLFARPGGNLSFNPLGNLSEISPSSGIGGTAPTAGEPLTWLQQALNGLAFMFQPSVSSTQTPAGNGGGGGTGNGSGAGGGRRFSLQ